MVTVTDNTRNGLPRMRGDRPYMQGAPFAIEQATPHARGSTRNGDYGTRVNLGYPACAGIDLPVMMGPRGCTRLPRMRGDRPHWVASH